MSKASIIFVILSFFFFFFSNWVLVLKQMFLKGRTKVDKIEQYYLQIP